MLMVTVPGEQRMSPAYEWPGGGVLNLQIAQLVQGFVQ
jgi:hypothetical protein